MTGPPDGGPPSPDDGIEFYKRSYKRPYIETRLGESPRGLPWYKDARFLIPSLIGAVTAAAGFLGLFLGS